MSRALAAEFAKLREAAAKVPASRTSEARTYLALLKTNAQIATRIDTIDAIAAVRSVREKIEALS